LTVVGDYFHGFAGGGVTGAIVLSADIRHVVRHGHRVDHGSRCCVGSGEYLASASGASGALKPPCCFTSNQKQSFSTQ
jgi:hypothetical protein